MVTWSISRSNSNKIASKSMVTWLQSVLDPGDCPEIKGCGSRSSPGNAQVVGSLGRGALPVNPFVGDGVIGVFVFLSKRNE